MKTHITRSQLFMLTFLYTLSGLLPVRYMPPFLLGIPIGVTILTGIITYIIIYRKTETLQGLFGKGNMILYGFLFLTVTEFVLAMFAAMEEMEGYTDFTTPFVLFAVLGLAVFSAERRGLTVLGRFSELSLFLLLPFLAFLFFPPYHAIRTVGETDFYHLLTAVFPLPLFYLMTMTVVPGDKGVSRAFSVITKKPENRAFSIFATAVSGTSAATLFRLILYRLESASLFLSLALAFTAHFTKLVLLSAFLVSAFPRKTVGSRFLGGTIFLAAVFFTVFFWKNSISEPLFFAVIFGFYGITMLFLLFYLLWKKRKSEP